MHNKMCQPIQRLFLSELILHYSLPPAFAGKGAPLVPFLYCCLFCLVSPLCNAQGTVAFSNVGAQPILNSLTGQPAEAGNIFSVSLYFAQDGIIDESLFVQVGPTIHIDSPGIFSAPQVEAPILPPGGFGMFQVRVWETIFGATYEQAAANRVAQGGRLALTGESGVATSIGVIEGKCDGGIRTAPIDPPGTWAMFQVRAWETAFGATYEEAVANRVLQSGRLALAGESGVMRVNTGDPTVYQLPASMIGGPPNVVTVVGAPLRDGFVLSVVPEPSTWALLAIGGVSFVWTIRRQRPR